MQGTDKPLKDLEAGCISADKVASLIISGVDRGEFIICKDSMAASLLFTSMTGPSPRRGFGIYDALMGLVVNWLVAPALRYRWEAMTRADGQEWRKTWPQASES
jgi:3-dehydrosphinganine reductase